MTELFLFYMTGVVFITRPYDISLLIIWHTFSWQAFHQYRTACKYDLKMTDNFVDPLNELLLQNQWDC